MKPGEITAKFAQVKSHLRLRKCEKITAKLPQSCVCGPPIAVLRNLRLRNRE